jgi:hypothetical protein
VEPRSRAHDFLGMIKTTVARRGVIMAPSGTIDGQVGPDPVRQVRILVGGKGTRLGEVTRAVPKPLLDW